MLIKQTYRSLYPEIQKEGCLFMSLLDMACVEMGEDLLPLEINRIYDYASPKFMDYNCFVKDHAEIIKLGFYILGQRFSSEFYGYRRDGDDIVIQGKPEQCNYWITKVDAGTFEHFYRSDDKGVVLYNPGVSVGKVLSLRGYCVRKLEE